MVNKSGRTNKDVLVVLDFDGTLVFADGSHENFDLLKELHKSKIELAIASRNDRYHLDRSLSRLGLDNLFTYVMADFRAKSYQMRHILMLYSRRGVTFSKIIFIDDYPPNIERMRKDVPLVQSLLYGQDITSFTELSDIIWN